MVNTTLRMVRYLTPIFFLFEFIYCQDIKQPIQFNHQHHIEDVEYTCMDCHVNAKSKSRASIPNISICEECHADMESDSEEANKVTEFVNSGTVISWIQVHRVPDHAYFSHRRHAAIAEIECTVCHGQVEAMTKPFQRPFTDLTMSWCVDCHKDSQIQIDCYSCHR